MLNILVAAAVLPLYHPVRLAEDIAVLDNLSKGRVTYVFGIGHRPEEYEHMGVDARRRGQTADSHLQLILELLKGGPVQVAGRRVHITPAASTQGGPRLMIAGGTAAAARRAGRHGLGFIAYTNTPGLKEAFEAESLVHEHEPGVPRSFPTGAAPQRFSSLMTSMLPWRRSARTFCMTPAWLRHTDKVTNRSPASPVPIRLKRCGRHKARTQ